MSVFLCIYIITSVSIPGFSSSSTSEESVSTIFPLLKPVKQQQKKIRELICFVQENPENVINKLKIFLKILKEKGEGGDAQSQLNNI